MKPRTLQQAIQYFSNEDNCIQTIAAMRWPNGVPQCPACGNTEHYYLAKQKRWKCKECWKQFSVKVGSIFEDSAISLDKWLIAIWMIANCKNGVSSYELARTIGITQKSAWFMLHRIRLAMADSAKGFFGGFDNPCEIDETYVGGKIGNMKKSKRRHVKSHGGAVGKAVVWGVLDRNQGKVKASVMPDAKRPTLEPAVRKHVLPGSPIMTDDCPAYYELKYDYPHSIIQHAYEYVRGHVHTNGIENFWSLLKRSLHGTYISVEPFHLQAYVEEQVFRYNNRGGKKTNKISDEQRFNLALSQIAGKRLTYANLTGKVNPTLSN